MSGLLLDFTELLRELDAIVELASSFLQRETTETVLPRYKSMIENLRHNPVESSFRLTIPEADPLTTITSEGKCEPSGKGPNAYATISSVWEVERIPPKKKRQPAKHLRICGLASTKVRIFEVKDGSANEVAMWRTEIGDSASPGCHFHVQILGDSNRPPFPHSLSVPRLPSLCFTPAAVLEYVLGELFQRSWIKEMARKETALHRWSPVQRARMERLLDWQKTAILNDPSPWLALKRAKPDSELFVE